MLDPVPGALDQVIATLDETRHAAHVYDSGWRLVHVTAAQQANVGAQPPIGAHVMSAEFNDTMSSAGTLSREDIDDYGKQLLPFILHDEPGGREGLCEKADSRYHHAIRTVEPRPLPSLWTAT